MNDIFSSQTFQLVKILIEALSIGFGVGWGLKKFLENIVGKFEKLENNQREMKEKQKKILKNLKLLTEEGG